MYSEIYKNAVYKDNKTVFRGLTVTVRSAVVNLAAIKLITFTQRW